MPPFGFFKRKEEPPADDRVHEVSLAELPSWFDGMMGEEIRKKKHEAEGIYGRLLESISEVRRSLERLDSARMSGTERVHIAANMIKESFVRKNYAQLNSMTSFYEHNYRPDYDYFTEFQERSMGAIKELKSSTPKQAILLSRYFKRESEQLVESIKKAEELSTGMKEFLSSGSGMLGTREKLKAAASSIAGLQDEMERLGSRASQLEKDTELVRERKSALEAKFLKLLKSRDWNDMNMLGKEVVVVREKLNDTRSRIETRMSSARRPFKKLEYALSDSGKLSPIQRNTLRDFVRDPLKALMQDKGEKNIEKCLRSIKELLDKGEMKLDDKEKAGIEEMVKLMEKEIPELKFKYMELNGLVEHMDRQIEGMSALSSSKERMENEIKRLGEEIVMLGNEHSSAKSRKSEMAAELEREVRELEALIREETGKRVRIKA